MNRNIQKEQEKIIEVIDQLRPFLVNDGGNIEFIKYEDSTVYVRLLGACTHCLMQDNTINDGLLSMFQDEIPEIKSIINVPL